MSDLIFQFLSLVHTICIGSDGFELHVLCRYDTFVSQLKIDRIYIHTICIGLDFVWPHRFASKLVLFQKSQEAR